MACVWQQHVKLAPKCIYLQNTKGTQFVLEHAEKNISTYSVSTVNVNCAKTVCVYKNQTVPS